MAKEIVIPARTLDNVFVEYKPISNSYIFMCSLYHTEQRAIIQTVVRQSDPTLQVGKLFVGDEVIGFIVRSENAINLRTGLLIPSPQWLIAENRAPIKPEDTRIVARTEEIVVVSAPAKFSIVTGTSVSDKLHSFLTMI